MLPVSEIFYSIQGEGKYTGYPSIFIRVLGCNLRCVFQGSMCDTPYTSFHPEKSKYKTITDVIGAVRRLYQQYPYTKHIVITGGEPLQYQNELSELVELIRDLMSDSVITIETNGTLPPLQTKVDLYSISPKLSTSVANQSDIDRGTISAEWRERHNKTRYNPENLLNIITSGEFQLKFVYSGKSCVEEIYSILEDLCKLNREIPMSYLHDHVMLMPEGINREQLEDHQQECVQVCLDNGWKYCDRLHIRIWDSKRGV